MGLFCFVGVLGFFCGLFVGCAGFFLPIFILSQLKGLVEAEIITGDASARM